MGHDDWNDRGEGYRNVVVDFHEGDEKANVKDKRSRPIWNLGTRQLGHVGLAFSRHGPITKLRTENGKTSVESTIRHNGRKETMLGRVHKAKIHAHAVCAVCRGRIGVWDESTKSLVEMGGAYIRQRIRYANIED